MLMTPSARGAGSTLASCFQAVKESKRIDTVLITGFVALLVIGILASTGVFNFMGTKNAAYLSYGMYGGAALFLIAEMIKLAIHCCKRTNHGPITKIVFGTEWQQRMPPQGTCQITFADGKTVDAGVSGYEASMLIQTIGRDNCSYEGDTEKHPADDFNDPPARWGSITLKQIVDRILKN